MFILKLILVLVYYYLLMVFFSFVKQKIDYNSGKVIKNNNIWSQAFQICCSHLLIFINISKRIVNSWKLYNDNQKMQYMKTEALQKTSVHLNQTLSDDLSINMIAPVFTNGSEVWVYLANNLKETERQELENYFIGVLAKYTTYFGLDYMLVELNLGAGWVARFKVISSEEASYNRMARASDVIQEERFDEDIDIWE